MKISRDRLLSLFREMPEQINVDEVMYRLYLGQKIDAAEKDIKEGNVMSHEELKKETALWFEK